MKYLIFILLNILILVSCRKTSEDIQTYPMKYVFINNGDKKLCAVTLLGSTIYPMVEDDVEYARIMKYRPLYNGDDPKRELLDIDTMFVNQNKQVYKGCRILTTVGLWFYDTLGVGLTPYRKYFRFDTIKSSSDCLITFVWPDDTTKFTLDKIPVIEK